MEAEASTSTSSCKLLIFADGEIILIFISMHFSGLTSKPKEVIEILEDRIIRPAVEQPAKSAEIVSGQKSNVLVDEIAKPMVKTAIVGSSDDLERDSSAEIAVVDILKELEDDDAQTTLKASEPDENENGTSVISIESEESSRTLMVVRTIPVPFHSGEFSESIERNCSKITKFHTIFQKYVFIYLEPNQDESSSLDVTSISNSTTEDTNTSVPEFSNAAAKEGVCTSTPVANVLSSGLTVSNPVPMVFLDVSDDSETSSKRSRELQHFVWEKILFYKNASMIPFLQISRW